MYVGFHVNYRFYCQVLMKLEFFDSCPKNTEISYFVKIRSLAAELFHADGRTDRRDEANAHFSLRTHLKLKINYIQFCFAIYTIHPVYLY